MQQLQRVLLVRKLHRDNRDTSWQMSNNFTVLFSSHGVPVVRVPWLSHSNKSFNGFNIHGDRAKQNLPLWKFTREIFRPWKFPRLWYLARAVRWHWWVMNINMFNQKIARALRAHFLAPPNRKLFHRQWLLHNKQQKAAFYWLFALFCLPFKDL